MKIEEYREQINELLERLRVKDPKPKQYAAHYTSAQTPKLMLETSAKNSMRQFDGDYMNDPEEGRYVVDVMIAAAQECSHQHKGVFIERLTKLRKSRLLYSAYRRATFLSCWTITQIKPGLEDSSDSLNHWRFYGDDGRGACLMIPLANMVQIFPQQLYRVIYGTESRGGGSAAADRPIRQLKENFRKRLDSIRKSYGNAVKDLEELIQATHSILFLFKSSEYKDEQEVRSIVHKEDYSKASSVNFDEREPKRAYVGGNEGLISNNSILYFGPKADHKLAIEVMGLAANLRLDVRVLVSSMPYR